MSKVKTIIFIDWDDTLFPTTHYKINEMNKQELKTLDALLNVFFKKYQINHNIFIVSNATAGWLKKSVSLLPLTYETMKKYDIPIISARDTFIDKYELSNCKEKTFQEIVKKYHLYNNYNIISIGDANYEYVGLLKMNDYMNEMNKKCLLKNIKFMSNPSKHEIHEQIKALTHILNDVIVQPKFVDILLNPYEN